MHRRSPTETIVSVQPAGRQSTTAPMFSALRRAEGHHPEVVEFEDYAALEVAVRVEIPDGERALAAVVNVLAEAGVPRDRYTVALR